MKIERAKEFEHSSIRGYKILYSKTNSAPVSEEDPKTDFHRMKIVKKQSNTGNDELPIKRQ